MIVGDRAAACGAAHPPEPARPAQIVLQVDRHTDRSHARSELDEDEHDVAATVLQADPFMEQLTTMVTRGPAGEDGNTCGEKNRNRRHPH